MEDYELGSGMTFTAIDGDSSRSVISANYEDTKNIDVVNGVPTIKKKKGRPKKGEREEDILARNADAAARVEANGTKVPATIMNSDTPIIDRYIGTTSMLQHTIMQTDQLASELKQDLDKVRTMKSTSLSAKVKYDAIGTLGSTIGNLLGNKIRAIQEMNKTLSDTNKLELQKYKEIGDRNAEKSSEERIMELYNAFINMPVGVHPGQSFVPINDATLGQSPVIAIGAPPTVNPNVISPEMNRLLLENNPNIQTVVIHDPTTGTNRFDVIDQSTGQSVPNYPRPGQMILEGLNVKTNQGIAINKDLNLEYPVVVQPSMPDVIHSSDPNLNQVISDMQDAPATPRKRNSNSTSGVNHF